MEVILSKLPQIILAFHLLWLLASADTLKMEDFAPKKCGNNTISYPFWISGQQPSYCGYSALEISCSDCKPLLTQSYNSAYYVKQLFYQNGSALLGDMLVDIITGNCSTPQFNVSFSFGPFVICSTNKLVKFFWNCETAPKFSSEFYSYSCGSNESYVRIYDSYTQENSEDNQTSCSISMVPFLGSNGGTVDQALSLMKEGFLVTWTVVSCSDCKASNGQCGFNSTNSMFLCICSDGTYPTSCPNNRNHGKTGHLEVILPGSLAGAFLLVMAVVIFLKLQRKYNAQENIEKLLKQYGSLAPRRYKYYELKKITHSFQAKLGRGGFGTVYEGKQSDGRMVAVKFLHDSTSNGEEFLNEVVSIGRTSHINIVSLLGFCIKGSKRALVYEYLPNSSLDKYIYSENPKTVLGWDKLYEIAIGVARGLEYLHRGCSTHIVHFDIKPQNILLDEDFCPKIADFGLAKLCPPKESVLSSMADLGGTKGFIAPEVFSRGFGVISTKLYVYSYGMMMMEMVGGRKNLKPSAQNPSEVYFPHWIYDRVAEGGDIAASDMTNKTEEIARKMALVGFWCTQTIPANRPSMGRVVEMLERSLDELELPPKPYITSPRQSMDLEPYSQHSLDTMSVQSIDSTAPLSNSEPSDGLR
ncbi:Protein kinase family protein [Rhynchospora pubera]|uniref:Protein kinase family protein n=1 Tax=Rhynchospora pubera TaxID=906938 RepID=A0AAV8DF20_9POAL|nr:Protein kinase family protein [Rhynchospora pubera]